MNPSFVFLQVFESQVLQRRSTHEPDNTLLPLPSNDQVTTKHLSAVSTRLSTSLSSATTTPILRPRFQDNLCKPVPE